MSSGTSGVSPEPRRWTLMWRFGESHEFPTISPSLARGERVVVMSVEEHDRAMAEARVDVENHRRNEEVALDALQESSSRNARLLSALESIRDRDWVENALDPQWGAGIARAALDASTTPSEEEQ